jgi:outer membrane protein
LRPTRFGALLSLLLAALLCPMPAWTQQELTLDQAVSLALQHNRQIKISQFEIQKAENAAAAMRTHRLPQFQFYSMGGELGNRINFVIPEGILGVYPQLGPLPAAPSTISTARKPFSVIFAQANQPLSQLFRIGLGVENEKLNREIANEKLGLQEQGIVNDVKKTYYNLLQTQSALGATEETVKLFHELERVASDALAQEVILKSDVLDTQMGLAKAETQAITLRNTTATLQERLNSLLGRDLSITFSVKAAPEATAWDLDLAATRARALEQRPELREARLKVKQAELDRRAKKAEYIPDVSLSFDYLGIEGIQFLPKNVSAVGLVLNWDVFDWGRKRHELISKTETVEQAKTAVEETAAQIQVEVGLDYRKLEEAREQLKVANLALAADQEKVRVALNRYEQRSVLLKDVLQLKASLADTTYKYQETLLSFWTARADLEKASGER